MVVLTDQPLRQILQKHNMFGCLVKWAIELSEFYIQYKPWPVIKPQVLADFITECTIPEETLTASSELVVEGTVQLSQPWILYVDGSFTPFASSTVNHSYQPYRGSGCVCSPLYSSQV